MDFKVKCINNHNNISTYTVGKIYTIKDGFITTDSGSRIGSSSISTFKDWCNWTSSKFELVEEKKMFTKADLKNGDVIKRRNGWVEIVCLETGTLITKDEFDKLSKINDDLTSIYGNGTYDIVAVRRPKYPKDCRFDAFDKEFGDLVYDRERDTVREMTVDEIEKELGYKVKVVGNRETT